MNTFASPNYCVVTFKKQVWEVQMFVDSPLHVAGAESIPSSSTGRFCSLQGFTISSLDELVTRFRRVWTALARGVHSREFMFKALIEGRQGLETSHDAYCSECGLLAARTGDDREGGKPDIFQAGPLERFPYPSSDGAKVKSLNDPVKLLIQSLCGSVFRWNSLYLLQVRVFDHKRPCLSVVDIRILRYVEQLTYDNLGKNPEKVQLNKRMIHAPLISERAFYASSKIAVYSFLVERVYVVWSPRIGGRGRLKSPVYIFSLIVVSLYAVVVILMIIGRVHFLRQGDGTCFMGLKTFSSYAILGYDMSISVIFTLMFLWPLLRAKLHSDRLKSVAVRTLIASAVALSSSSANTLGLAILKGREEGWLCLGSCSLDIICNASAVFWITRGSSQNDESTNRLTQAPESRLESGRITSHRNPLAGRSTIESIEMQRNHHARPTADISVNDLFRTDAPEDAKSGVHVTVTTHTTHDESMKSGFFSDDAIRPIIRGALK
ncbi:hypothetical protein D9757_013478 [Collybiopsis confluens]|uniref:Uncharacterized protein n=1 Tax=Collybiopsis confluens TaxID=2823264 RepID=A0A8H5CP67_9AGAR|nr:hypothetical protein D9757_013478 [Collybiopsis confluens]